MNPILLLMLVVVTGATSTEAGEQLSPTETQSYTIRLKNNSNHKALLKIGRVSIDKDCNQVTDVTTSELGDRTVMDLSCSPMQRRRYCIRTIEGDKGAELPSWVQLDCTENPSPVLNLNLFGR